MRASHIPQLPPVIFKVKLDTPGSNRNLTQKSAEAWWTLLCQVMSIEGFTFFEILLWAGYHFSYPFDSSHLAYSVHNGVVHDLFNFCVFGQSSDAICNFFKTEKSWQILVVSSGSTCGSDTSVGQNMPINRCICLSNPRLKWGKTSVNQSRHGRWDTTRQGCCHTQSTQGCKPANVQDGGQFWDIVTSQSTNTNVYMSYRDALA